MCRKYISVNSLYYILQEEARITQDLRESKMIFFLQFYFHVLCRVITIGHHEGAGAYCGLVQ